MKVNTFDRFLAHQIQDLNLTDLVPEQLRQIFLRVSQMDEIHDHEWHAWNAMAPYIMSAISEKIAPSNSAFFPPVNLQINECVTDAYQRSINQQHLRDLEKNFDTRALEPITVNRRADGSLIIVDGQHRTLAASHKGYSSIAAKLYRTPLSYSEEAAQHLKLGTMHKSLSLYDAFRNQIEAQDSEALEIQRIVQDFGYDIGRNGHREASRGKIAAVRSLMTIFRKNEGNTLRTILGIMQDTWGANADLSKMMLEGLAYFHDTFSGVYDSKRLIACLRLIDPILIRQRATVQATHTLHGNKAGALALAEIYNQRRTAKWRLKIEWIYDGRPNSA